jgi:COP9 signalosome complex subunit 7
MSELDIATVRELEDMVVDAVYKCLLCAKLSQRLSCVEVSFAAARDVSVSAVSGMINKLKSWFASTQQVTSTLEHTIEKLNAEDQANQVAAKQHADQIAEQQAIMKASAVRCFFVSCFFA